MTLTIRPARTLTRTLTESIGASTGPHRRVLSALYRELVTGNFAQYEGKGGRAAAARMTDEQFAHELLPDFMLKSGKFTAGDVIVLNIQGHSPSDGYELLPDIFRGLDNAGVIKTLRSPSPFSNSLWHLATLAALHRYSDRHKTNIIVRAQLIAEELPQIVSEARSRGGTPSQTLSRVLQELRDSQILHHLRSGAYLLLDKPLDADRAEATEEAIDAALTVDQLLLSDVPTSDTEVIARRRIGQARLRQFTLLNYGHRCALCDVDDPALLVASHIDRWADNLNAQGRLCNTICLCRMHDALFENGYISFADDLSLILRGDETSATVQYLQKTTLCLRAPTAHSPSPQCLAAHRRRTGLVAE